MWGVSRSGTNKDVSGTPPQHLHRAKDEGYKAPTRFRPWKKPDVSNIQQQGPYQISCVFSSCIWDIFFITRRRQYKFTATGLIYPKDFAL